MLPGSKKFPEDPENKSVGAACGTGRHEGGRDRQRR